MTLDEFIDELAATDRQETWELWEGSDPVFPRKVLRCLTGHCPITFVCERKTGVRFTNFSYRQAAYALDLQPYYARLIVDAADGFGSRELQARLARACGLKEQNG